MVVVVPVATEIAVMAIVTYTAVTVETITMVVDGLTGFLLQRPHA
jgi:hypothetical protein